MPLWSGLKQATLGTQLTQADVIGGGPAQFGWPALSWAPSRNLGVAMAAGVANSGFRAMVTTSSLAFVQLFYNNWDSVATIGDYAPALPGVQDVSAGVGAALAATGDLAHEVVVRTGRAVGGTIGGMTGGFRDQDPDTAAAIGSAFKGGDHDHGPCDRYNVSDFWV